MYTGGSENMGKKFDSRVEKAVDILWLHMQFDRGLEARKLLEEAAAEKDADAYFFLARCYAGSCFVNSSFGLEEDNTLWEEYLNKSIENGSAVGMFGAKRFGGFRPRCGSYIQKPYQTAKEVWDEVKRLADDGELFCQILLANAYYYGDPAYFFGIDIQRLSQNEWEGKLHEWTLKAIPIYENLIAHGVMMGLVNYIDIVRSGDNGIPKDEKKARQLEQIGADHDMSWYQIKVGRYLEESNLNKAEEYYNRALKLHDMDACYYLGSLYSFNGKRKQDLQKAKYYFEMGLAGDPESNGCNNRLGEIYFYGGDGIEADYSKAVQHFLAASNQDNHWAYDMLGMCYLKGLGTETDYKKAKLEFERYQPSALAAIGLGEIYAYGLGVPEDIAKGIHFWQKYPDHPQVKENMKNFKRSLLGSWKRKKV